MNFLEAIDLVGIGIIDTSSRVTLNLFRNMGLLEAICAAIIVTAAIVVRVYQVLVLRCNSHCGSRGRPHAIRKLNKAFFSVSGGALHSLCAMRQTLPVGYASPLRRLSTCISVASVRLNRGVVCVSLRGCNSLSPCVVST